MKLNEIKSLVNISVNNFQSRRGLVKLTLDSLLVSPQVMLLIPFSI